MKKSKLFLLFFVSILLIISVCKKQNKLNSNNKIYTFKYANAQSDTHPRSKSMFFFKEQLEKASNNRINVELYTSGILGKEEEVLEMVKQGIIHGCRGGLFEKANKKYLIYTLPFLFENTNQVSKVIRSEFGDEINKDTIKNGYYIPACGIAGGFRNITNNIRPIKSPADFKGLILRTPPIDMTIKTFNVLGAKPQQISYAETFMALKQGVVDGQENPFSNIVDMEFYKAQKYLSVLNWQIHPDPFYINPDWYNNLPEDLKKIFDSTVRETILYSDKIWLDSEKNFYNFLKDKLETNTISSNSRKAFTNAVKSVWQYYIDKNYFTWDDINKIISISKQE